MRQMVLLAATLFFVVACGSGGYAQPLGTIQGSVTMGPMQPVCRVGENCEDAAFGGAKVVVFARDGRLLARMLTDKQGAFSAKVQSGTVTVRIEIEGPLPRCGDAQADVKPGAVVSIHIDCDSGIR